MQNVINEIMRYYSLRHPEDSASWRKWAETDYYSFFDPDDERIYDSDVYDILKYAPPPRKPRHLRLLS